MSLPIHLLLLSLISLPRSICQQLPSPLTLNAISSVTLTTTVSTLELSLPDSADAQLAVSFSICDDTEPQPQFAVSSGASFEPVDVDKGVGVWSGELGSAGAKVRLSVDSSSAAQGSQWKVEVGVSTGDALHGNLSASPVLGDTTSRQAIFFSPPFSPPPFSPPSYPNYTLPPGNLTWPEPPAGAQNPNASLILVPASAAQQNSAFTALAHSACALKGAANATTGALVSGTDTQGVLKANESTVMRDVHEGWRTQWVLDGLDPLTNYTAWVVQSGSLVAGPINAFTKSASFPCPLVHSLPFCPSVSYSVPLPPPPDGSATYTAANLPANLSEGVISSLSNFTSALLTFACGRDVYSPIQSCADCQDAYRTWACLVSLPRCSEPPPSLTSSASSSSAPTPSMPALLQHPPAPARSNLFPDISSTTPYSELLPCIETCQLVDRTCPPMIGWRCPSSDVNANASYGIGFIDGWDGTEGAGSPGVAQDRFGVAWCNAP